MKTPNIAARLAALLLVLGATRVLAVPAESAAIPAGEISTRAELDERYAENASRRAEAAVAAAAFRAALGERRERVSALQQRLRKTDLAHLPIRRLETLERHWRFHARDLADWRESVQRAIKPLSEDAAELAHRRTAWIATRDGGDPASPLARRASEALLRLQAAEGVIHAPLAALLRESRAGSELAQEISSGAAHIRRQIDAADRALLRADHAALWQSARATAAAKSDSVLSQSLVIETEFARDLDESRARLRQASFAGLVLLLPLLVLLWRRTVARARREAVAEDLLRVLTRPFAAWLVLCAVSLVLLDWDGPLMRQQLVLLLAWLPVLRLMPRPLLRVVGPWAWVSAIFYALNVLVSLTALRPEWYRLALLALDAAMLLVLLLLWRAHRRLEASAATRRMRLLLIGTTALTALAIAANAFGNVALAALLSDGLLDASYLAVALSAAASVVAALSSVVLRRTGIAALRHSHARTGALVNAAYSIGRVGLILFWLWMSLDAFRIERPLRRAIEWLFGYRIGLGEISLTLGNIALFLFAAGLALWLARTVRLLLSEDVLPNLALPRGLAHSVSTLSYYALAVLGLLLALAVAGFQVGQLALVFGALGVGIGLGLQNVVNNFVSGLILMVERPVQAGDVVEVAGTTGRIKEIGLRATRIITFDGADVVIPNGTLLADKLINWTLSTSSRRIEVSIGVAYGSDPRQVLDLLRRVAAGTEGVLADPAPSALLVAFGAHSLDFSLRAWTRDEDDWAEIRSQMAIGVHDALQAAAIAIPFPQSELHLRTVSPEAAAALRHAFSPSNRDPR